MGSASPAPARAANDRTLDLAVATFFGFEKAVTAGRVHTGGHAVPGRGETSGPDGG